MQREPGSGSWFRRAYIPTSWSTTSTPAARMRLAGPQHPSTRHHDAAVGDMRQPLVFEKGEERRTLGPGLYPEIVVSQGQGLPGDRKADLGRHHQIDDVGALRQSGQV